MKLPLAITATLLTSITLLFPSPSSFTIDFIDAPSSSKFSTTPQAYLSSPSSPKNFSPNFLLWSTQLLDHVQSTLLDAGHHHLYIQFGNKLDYPDAYAEASSSSRSFPPTDTNYIVINLNPKYFNSSTSKEFFQFILLHELTHGLGFYHSHSYQIPFNSHVSSHNNQSFYCSHANSCFLLNPDLSHLHQSSFPGSLMTLEQPLNPHFIGSWDVHTLHILQDYYTISYPRYCQQITSTLSEDPHTLALYLSAPTNPTVQLSHTLYDPYCFHFFDHSISHNNITFYLAGFTDPDNPHYPSPLSSLSIDENLVSLIPNHPYPSAILIDNQQLPPFSLYNYLATFF